jgi:hypothetical protein
MIGNPRDSPLSSYAVESTGVSTNDVIGVTVACAKAGRLSHRLPNSGGAPSAANGSLLERAKIKIVENRPGRAIGERPVVPFEERDPIAEYAVGQARRRFVRKDHLPLSTATL